MRYGHHPERLRIERSANCMPGYVRRLCCTDCSTNTGTNAGTIRAWSLLRIFRAARMWREYTSERVRVECSPSCMPSNVWCVCCTDCSTNARTNVCTNRRADSSNDCSNDCSAHRYMWEQRNYCGSRQGILQPPKSGWKIQAPYNERIV